MIEYKIAHGGLGLKEDASGEFTAIIASLAPVVDHDGDVTVAGAIPDGSRVVVSRYNHSSAKGESAPVGYATITTDDRYAYAQGQFFLNTPEGRSTYDTLKGLHEAGI